ncbi:hypothetical protein Ahy_B06g081340 isoform F [Arachis hypogaea]|uniref:Uncharacterized protein n=1 Tax=Arachis hypogaea TaxID=3818 RepID=A0A444YKR7_ARAHY|nr:hypothetical protein Ahy_B06g081340 isoform F [Arachis hypogaea]
MYIINQQLAISFPIKNGVGHHELALILQLKYAEHNLCKYLQALILQLNHVPLSPGSHSIYTGIPN